MVKITDINIHDVRFPTSEEQHGSDSMHVDPDYSAAYVIIHTDEEKLKGYGMTFTLGRGTEVVCLCIKAFEHMVIGKDLDKDILTNFGKYWGDLTNESQLRWLGPEKGVSHLAVAAIINAIWDLWARREGKPVWRLLVEMKPEQIVQCIDFRWITDALTKEEAISILKKAETGKAERIQFLEKNGFPSYTTSAGWLGYSNDLIRNLCKENLARGWQVFKIKVGTDLEDDKRRLQIVREEIGPDRRMMVDANQKWDVETAISWMKQLAEFKPWFIEEPTSPDDVLGHARIRKELAPFGVKVATGEHCQNRVMFKQFLQAQGLDFCQIDSCRMGGVNEILSVILMCKKFGVVVMPHAGGVGLCEYVQHLTYWDYCSVAGSMKDTYIEYSDHLHEHFVDPVIMKDGNYMAPTAAGYSIEMKPEAIKTYEFPIGTYWSLKIASRHTVPTTSVTSHDK